MKPASFRHGFTLLEILVVIAIFAALAVLAMPAFHSLRGTRDLAKTAYDIQGLLEQARARAMAQNTYVWVGFHQPEPDEPLVVGVVASKTGAANPGSEYRQIGKLARFENIRFLVLTATDGRPSGADVTQLAGAKPPLLSFTLGNAGEEIEFDAQVIQWNSRGEARVSVGGISKLIEIGLQSSANGIVTTPEDFAAIQIGGLTGAASLYRP